MYFLVPPMEKIVRKHSRQNFLFEFDPLDSPVEKEISTISTTDFEEILILTYQIGLWKRKST